MKNKAKNRHKGILSGLAMVASLVVSLVFSGCGSSMPECDDKKVLDLVTQISQDVDFKVPLMCDSSQIKENAESSIVGLGNSQYEQKLLKLGYKSRKAYCEARKYSYSAFMADSINKETKKVSCKAKLIVKSPHSETLSPIFADEAYRIGFMIGFLGGNTSNLSHIDSMFREEYFVKYTAQHTQDGQVYVEVLGYE